ncbi:MAG TPA: hypothetical protein VKG38_04175 [Solirubrobacteraceae bacterium]|nr:hypothetical protein [Solirubrobacteraceae bacterium]
MSDPLASTSGADSQAGFPSRELGVDPVTGRKGSNQWLGHSAAHHNGQFRFAPGGNRVAPGKLPLTSGPPVGPPDAAGPLGRGFGESQSSD